MLGLLRSLAECLEERHGFAGARRALGAWGPCRGPHVNRLRGYPQELEDFVDAIRDRREPLSGATLARDVVEVIYAGSLSAARGRRVELARR